MALSLSQSRYEHILLPHKRIKYENRRYAFVNKLIYSRNLHAAVHIQFAFYVFPMHCASKCECDSKQSVIRMQANQFDLNKLIAIQKFNSPFKWAIKINGKARAYYYFKTNLTRARTQNFLTK